MTDEKIIEGFLPSRFDLHATPNGKRATLMFGQRDGAAVHITLDRSALAAMSSSIARFIGDPLLAATERSSQPSVIAAAIRLVSSPELAAVVLEVFPLQQKPFRLGIPPELVSTLSLALQKTPIASA